MQVSREVAKFDVAWVVRGSAPVAAVVYGHHSLQFLDTTFRERDVLIALGATNLGCR